MNWSKTIRQAHRWLGNLFVASVLVATFAAATEQDTESVLYYLPLPPLFFMMVSGLYLFALPYLARRRRQPGDRI